MVYNCVFWLNSFPHKYGVHSTISPRAIMTGQRITYDKHCKLEFGTYVQTHEKHDNSMEPRTSVAIALRPSGNKQGGHCFLSLHTGKRILRNNWTVLPKGLGNKGDEVILKEIKQLHIRQALMPCSRDNLSYEERKRALRYLMFLKENRDGTIKARGCADWRPQRLYTSKEDTSWPTVSIEAMMLLRQ